MLQQSPPRVLHKTCKVCSECIPADAIKCSKCGSWQIQIWRKDRLFRSRVLTILISLISVFLTVVIGIVEYNQYRLTEIINATIPNKEIELEEISSLSINCFKNDIQLCSKFDVCASLNFYAKIINNYKEPIDISEIVVKAIYNASSFDFPGILTSSEKYYLLGAQDSESDSKRYIELKRVMPTTIGNSLNKNLRLETGTNIVYFSIQLNQDEFYISNGITLRDYYEAMSPNTSNPVYEYPEVNIFIDIEEFGESIDSFKSREPNRVFSYRVEKVPVYYIGKSNLVNPI